MNEVAFFPSFFSVSSGNRGRSVCVHEHFPWLWQSICGQTLCTNWTEGLLAHNPDSQGQGRNYLCLTGFVVLVFS